MNLLQHLRSGLKRTQEALVGRMEAVFSGKILDEGSLGELEEILLSADVGVATTEKILASLRENVKRGSVKDPWQLKKVIKDELLSLLDKAKNEGGIPEHAGPRVILVLGVNGTGKTTTIAKLAHRYQERGKSVLLAAGDTYRAAAIDQLQIWADRIGADIIQHQPGGDPSAVAFDAVNAAVARRKDILIIDTAGRLHTNRGLMDELAKMKRTVQRLAQGAPHEMLLVLDATTGSNGLQQAKDFQQAVGITGLVIAKLDGTAKGGIVFAIADRLGIPVKYIGLGEDLEDLQDFDPQAFVDALFEN
jgi:fused signal recognition particle receptor